MKTLALVTSTHVGPCPWCRKPAGFVELKQGEARWQRIEPHGQCVTTTRGPKGKRALSDLVDEHEEVPLGV